MEAGTSTVLSVEALSKEFGRIRALVDASFELKAGEAVALLGPNGAGKTTALKLLMGLLRPTRGRAFVLGRDCTVEPDEVRRLVGYSPDEPGFYDFLTGNETLDFVMAVRGLERGRAWRELAPLIQAFEFGSVLSGFVHGYSLGAKKKLALLAALVHRPPLLLLDEPTNGLDPASVIYIRETLRQRVSEGAALLLSTHHLDLAASLAPRALLIRRGEIVEDGPIDRVKAVIERDVPTVPQAGDAA